jgi:uncharacterized membrane protein YeaQ/YmgE (transglycosylase-associated protein family)
MAVIGWLVFGLLVGLVARFVMPGRQQMGIITTTLLGVVGSLIGGYVGHLLAGQAGGPVEGAGFIGSVLGALALLAIAAAIPRTNVNVP